MEGWRRKRLVRGAKTWDRGLREGKVVRMGEPRRLGG